MDDILFSSATELAASIRAREVSAMEVLEAHLQQIARHNPALNAIVTMDEEGARRRALEADEALSRGEVWGPLHGVPMTLKDSHSTAGMRTTAGFQPWADYIPAEDSTVTARLKAAGAIIIGKTNVPVLLADIQTDNPIFGRSNNPWNLDRTPGGSSGGAGAALAAGLTPLEIGSDIGGSIRIPAHFCGVFGLKPTVHRIPLTGHLPGLPDSPRSARVMAVIGPLARTVDDLVLAFRLLAGPDGRDTHIAPVPLRDIPRIALQDIRFAWARSFPGFQVANEVGTALENLASQLVESGVQVEERYPDLDFAQQKRVYGKLVTQVMEVFQRQPEGTAPITLADYLTLLHQRDAYVHTWEMFFQDWDVLLCPTTMTTAFAHCPTETPITVNGEVKDYWHNNTYCQLFNLTGHPAVILPYTRDADGLPIGVQVVGRRWDDERLLAIAGALVEVTGSFERPPGY